MVERRDYGPWGLRLDERIKAEGSEAREDYTGHEFDAPTGLVYAGARYYIPALGRWNARDPILGEQSPMELLERDPRFLSQSPYNYVWGDPMRLMDPDGKDPCCLTGLDLVAASLYLRTNEEARSQAMQGLISAAEYVGLAADAATLGLAAVTTFAPQAGAVTLPAMAQLQAIGRSADFTAMSIAATDEFVFGGQEGQFSRTASSVALGEVVGKASRLMASRRIIQHVPEGRGSSFQWAPGMRNLRGERIGGRWAPNNAGEAIQRGAGALGAMPPELMMMHLHAQEAQLRQEIQSNFSGFTMGIVPGK